MTEYFCCELKIPFDLRDHKEIARVDIPLEDLKVAQTCIKIVSQNIDFPLAVVSVGWNLFAGVAGENTAHIHALAYGGQLFCEVKDEDA